MLGKAVAHERAIAGRLVRIGFVRAAVVEQVLTEAEHPAAEHVEGVMGEVDA